VVLCSRSPVLQIPDPAEYSTPPQSEVARLAPIFDHGLGEARLREVVSEQFRLGIDNGREFFAQSLGDAQVQDLPAAL
jgi:hypothetical protein